MVCAGYGKYFAKCTNKPKMREGHYWCKRCDDLRKATNKKELDAIVDGFKDFMNW